MAASTALPDVPLPEDAQEVAYDAGQLEFASPTGIEALVNFYRDALAADGWEEQEDFTQVDDSVAFVEFDRGDEYIFISVFDFDGSSEATLDLTGAPSLAGTMDENEQAAGPPDGPGYTIADWPTPPGATEVDVSGDTLSFKTALPLADVAEFYRPTFEVVDVSTSCLDDVADYTSLSCSSSNGDVSLNFFAFEGFDNTEVEIEFTNYALAASNDSSISNPNALGVDEEDGLPLPDDNSGYSSEGGQFSRRIDLSSPSDLDTLVEFFQTELGSRGWTLDESDLSSGGATLHLSGPDGELVVTLQSGDETEVTLVLKDTAGATEAGILPPSGQARLYLVNFSDNPLTVTVDGQVFDLAGAAGQESPDDAPSLDLPPGTYEVTTEVGETSVTDEVTVGPDEAWGLLLDEQGALPLQMY